jgi:DnaJ-like protein
VTDSSDPYEVLDVGKTATQDEIGAAYKRLIRLTHPGLGGCDACRGRRRGDSRMLTGVASLVRNGYQGADGCCATLEASGVDSWDTDCTGSWATRYLTEPAAPFPLGLSDLDCDER